MGQVPCAHALHTRAPPTLSVLACLGGRAGQRSARARACTQRARGEETQLPRMWRCTRKHMPPELFPARALQNPFGRMAAPGRQRRATGHGVCDRPYYSANAALDLASSAPEAIPLAQAHPSGVAFLPRCGLADCGPHKDNATLHRPFRGRNRPNKLGPRLCATSAPCVCRSALQCALPTCRKHQPEVRSESSQLGEFFRKQALEAWTLKVEINASSNEAWQGTRFKKPSKATSSEAIKAARQFSADTLLHY